MLKRDLTHLLKPQTVVETLASTGLTCVLKAPGGFACGICGTKFTGIKDAWSCLKLCILFKRLRTSVSRQPAARGQFFQCNFCFKKFQNLSDAEFCAQDCFSKLAIPDRMRGQISKLQVLEAQEKLQRNRKALGRANPEPPPQPRERAYSKTNEMRHGTLSEGSPVKLPFQPTHEIAVEALKAPANGISPTLKAEDLFYRTHGQKSFKRMDAKYACTVCSNTFFTKSDVEKCFMGHALLDPEV